MGPLLGSSILLMLSLSISSTYSHALIDFGTLDARHSAESSRESPSGIDFGSLGSPGSTESPKNVPTVPIVNVKEQKNCACVPEGKCAGQPGLVGPRETKGLTFDIIFMSRNSSKSAGGSSSSSSSSSSRIVNKPPEGAYCYEGDVYCCNPPPEPEPEIYKCGVSTVIKVPGYPDIVGQANFGKYPWQAILLSENDMFIGSGVLIDNFNVLTVAHRINNARAPLAKVRLGDWDVNAEKEPYKYEEVQVESVIIHPEFNPLSLQNDVAVLRLSKPPKFTKGKHPHINSACLTEHNANFDGSRCWVSGYGRDAYLNGKISSILREVDVPIVDGTTCQDCLRGNTLGKGFLLDRNSFICAGGEVNKDACEGDGGSALICAGSNGRGYVAGLVAWGLSCAEKNVPGVYVNVPNFVPWIRSNLV